MDPISAISAVAAVDAVASLAGKVIYNGYKYIRSVQGCPDEVSQLIGEVGALQGLLSELAGETKEEAATDPGDLPQFATDCFRTLAEIDSVLQKFNQEDAKTVTGEDATTPARDYRVWVAKKARVLKSKAIDLTWPWEKKKTMDMLAQLERYKTLCTLALSAAEWEDVKSILGQQQDANSVLKQVAADTKRLTAALEATELTAEVNKTLDWICSYEPSESHNVARDLHTTGTGTWIFQEPEFVQWSVEKNSALWIHGIPGAGKTILMSLIIDRLSADNIGGTAFFYCDYKNPQSQEPLNVLGSLIRQLTLQNRQCWKTVKAFFKSHHPEKLPARKPTLGSLATLLQDISKDFQDVTLMLDGLDECGSPAVRSDLLRILSRLHSDQAGHISLLVASRDERDIRERLSDFSDISIAARNADLKLYVYAQVFGRSRLRVKSDGLRQKIIDTLINHSMGMFMWCRCQLDYLAKLPNDRLREQALEPGQLTPDLPSMYIRILDRLEKDYPQPTVLLVKRTLKWLALHQHTDEPGCALTLSGLVQAISLDDSVLFDSDAVPDQKDLMEWCTSLIRFNKSTKMIEFSHFSVEEFLQSELANDFRINEERDHAYMSETCLHFLSLKNFNQSYFILNATPLEKFQDTYPFYGHAAYQFPNYLRGVRCPPDSAAAKRFFQFPESQTFSTWRSFISYSRSLELVDSKPGPEISKPGQWYSQTHSPWSGIRLAAALLLDTTVERLLLQGAKANALCMSAASPLHTAIGGPYTSNEVYHNIPWDPVNDHGLAVPAEISKRQDSRRLEVVAHLIEAGASLQAGSGEATYHIRKHVDLALNPAETALYYLRADVLTFLAKYNATLRICNISDPEKHSNAVEHTKEGEFPDLDDLLGRADFVGLDKALSECLSALMSFPNVRDKAFALLEGRNSLESEESDLSSGDVNSKDEEGKYATRALLIALKVGNRVAYDEALRRGAFVTAVVMDDAEDQTTTALYEATKAGNIFFTRDLVRLKADPFTFAGDGDSPYTKVLREQGPQKLHEYFGATGDFEFTSSRKWAAFRSACEHSNLELLEFLVDSGLTTEPDTKLLNLEADGPDFKEADIVKIVLEYKMLANDQVLRLLQLAWEGYEPRTLEVLYNSVDLTTMIDPGIAPQLTPRSLPSFIWLANQGCFNDNMITSLRQQVEALSADWSADENAKQICRHFRFYELQDTLFVRSLAFEERNRQGNNPIHQACVMNDAVLLERLLQRGDRVDRQNEEGKQAIHIAAGLADSGCLGVLLRHAADPNCLDRNGWRPIHHMYFRGNFGADGKALNVLLNGGGLVDALDETHHDSALHFLVEFQRDEETLQIGMQAVIGRNATAEILNTSGKGPIHCAAEGGNLAAVKELVRLKSSLTHQLSQFNKSPLHYSASAGHPEVCNFLLENNADRDATDAKTVTPLLDAAQGSSANSAAVVDLLLRAGANHAATDAQGRNALHVAAFKGTPSSVERLLEEKPNVNARTRAGRTALANTVMWGRAPHASLLLKAGADANEVSEGGMTLLQQAAKSGLAQIVLLLTEHGADLEATDSKGATAMDYANDKGKAEIVEILTRAGAKPASHSMLELDFTAMWTAAQQGSRKSMMAQIAQGILVNKAEREHLWTPLHFAAGANKLELLEYLLGINADMDARTRHGETPLLLALRLDALDTFSFLLQRSKSPFTTAAAGATILHFASLKGLEDIVTRLVKLETFRKAEVNRRCTWHGTPLALAARGGHVEIMTKLLDAGAALEGPQSWEGSVLAVACAEGREDAVEFLLSRGAKGDCEGALFPTALAAAQAYRRADIVKLLQGAQLSEKGDSSRDPTMTVD